MRVFWVIFLVLLNTIGNQGDPKHGLIAPEPVPEELPMNIVSMRNDANCHICTGSIISQQLILSSLSCDGATHYLHGLREYENCTVIHEGNYRNITVISLVTSSTRLYELCFWLPVPKEEGWKTRPKCEDESVEKEFGNSIERLLIPRNPLAKFYKPVAVLGWFFDSTKRKFIMNKIDEINTDQAFSNEANEAFFWELCKLGTGSPFIHNTVIYGILSCSHPYRFHNILADVELIRSMIDYYS